MPYIEEMSLSYAALAKAMNLPDSVKIVSVHDGGHFGSFKIRLALDHSLGLEGDDSIEIENFQDWGDALANPQKYTVPGKINLLQKLQADVDRMKPIDRTHY